MNVKLTARLSRDKSRIFYSFDWGKKAGQRIATGVFVYACPAGTVQKNHNKEALKLLEVKRSQLTLDALSVGTRFISSHRYECNFLSFYKDYVNRNKQFGNRHLECSYNQFKKFVRSDYISPKDITEEYSANFQKYLLRHFNGETPSNYFARYKKVLKSATRQGYFLINPCQDLPVKANKNIRRKSNLEAEEYIKLVYTPALNEEVKEAFVFCCYTGLRWCDVKVLKWDSVGEDSIVFNIFQQKTNVEHCVTLHPVAREILDRRRNRLKMFEGNRSIFYLPTADGANKVLQSWCKLAGIEKHITWHCARLSFSILLQDANVDAATVALLLGHTSSKYVNESYKRYRPKDQNVVIRKLPS
jgi:integrase